MAPSDGLELTITSGLSTPTVKSCPEQENSAAINRKAM
jgi:hypothetical protein